MVKSYCVKEKKQTVCFQPFDFKQTDDGRWMFFSKCGECGIKKTKFVNENFVKTIKKMRDFMAKTREDMDGGKHEATVAKMRKFVFVE